MTMLQKHMLNINKKSVSKGTLDAILLRLANSAISSPKQNNNNKKNKIKKDLEKCSIAPIHTVWEPLQSIYHLTQTLLCNSYKTIHT